MLCMLAVIPALLFWGSSALMVLFLLLFALVYVTLYWRLARFRSPRWMRLLAPRARPRLLEPHHREPMSHPGTPTRARRPRRAGLSGCSKAHKKQKSERAVFMRRPPLG
jgi:hypothetical protein